MRLLRNYPRKSLIGNEVVVQGGGQVVEAGQLPALHLFLLLGEQLGFEQFLDSPGKQLPA